jgi:hypothetical protein
MPDQTATATEAATTATTSAATTQAAASTTDASAQTATQVAQTATAVVPSPFGEDGKLGKDWFLKLGDEYSAHAPDLSKITDIRTLLTEREYFRKNGVSYPGENAQPAEIDRFRKVAGVPDSPEGYGLTAEAMALPEGMEFDSELAAAITQAAHKTHAPPAVVAAIAAEFNTVLAKRMADAAAAEAATKKAAQDELVTAWRGDFETNASTVRHWATKLAESANLPADSPFIASFMNDINTQPALSKMLMEVSKLYGEDRIAAPNGFGDLRSAAERVRAIEAGTDPQWGAKYLSKDKAEALEAYKFVASLRAQASR